MTWACRCTYDSTNQLHVAWTFSTTTLRGIFFLLVICILEDILANKRSKIYVIFNIMFSGGDFSHTSPVNRALLKSCYAYAHGTKWASDWLMEFNIPKCNILQITLLHSKSSFTYKMSNILLSTVFEHNYLGISAYITDYPGSHISTVSVTKLTECLAS